MNYSKACFSHGAFFFLLLNFLLFSLVTATCTCPSPQRVNSKPSPSLRPKNIPPLTACTCPSQPSQPASSRSPTSSFDDEKCPRDALHISACAKLLNNDLLEVILGKPPVTPCCTLVEGLVDFEAAVCLCTAIKVSVLGIDLVDVPVSLSLLAGNCGREIPPSFQCP